MKKSTIDTRWVSTPIRQRLVTSRKRALRSRSVKAARSVCSGHQSRVLKLRKNPNAEVFLHRGRGDRIELTVMTMGSLTRPESLSMAEVCVGILGTCEGLSLPVRDDRNGMTPIEKRPRTEGVFPQPLSVKQWKETGYCLSSIKQERQDGALGRLSPFIVAIENRETLFGRSL